MKLDPTPDVRCGTYAGFAAHRRRNETACVDCKQANKIKANTWAKNNKNKVQAYRKKYNAENAEAISAQKKIYNLAYRAANSDKVRQYAYERRARKLNVVNEFYTVDQVLELYGTNCHLCNEPIDFNAPRIQGKPNWHKGLHIDHVIPLSKGGSDTLDNVRPSHAYCNLSKRNKLQS